MRPLSVLLILFALTAFGEANVLFAQDLDPYYKFSTTKPPESPYKNTWGAYQTDLYSGSFNYNFKIEVPPGTNGLTPKLSISYNNQNAKGKAGWAGAGWEIPLTYIQRNIQYNRKNNPSLTAHTFELYFESAKNNLVTSDGTSFHTQVETYYNVQKKTGAPNQQTGEYWTVTVKDGTQYRFGYNPDSIAMVNVSTDTSFTKYPWRWSLDQIKDTNGNCINFSYFQDQGSVYLDTITYNNDAKRVIKFIREAKPDAYLIIDQGSEVLDAYRLHEVDISVNGALVRKYTLGYTLNQAQNKSLLTSITEYGSDGTTSLPPVTFQYAVPGNGFQSPVNWSTPGNLDILKIDQSANDVIGDMIDVNGDGLPDIVRVQTTKADHDNWEIWLNTGNGFSATSFFWSIPKGWTIRNSYNGTQTPSTKSTPLDFNGDGCIDFFDAEGDGNLNYVCNTTGSNCTPSYVSQCPGYQNLTNTTTFPSNANSQYRYMREEDLQYNSSLGYHDPHVQQTFIDVNGDGLPDLVQRVDGSTWHVWINKGPDSTGKPQFVDVGTWTVYNHNGYIEDYTTCDDQPCGSTSYTNMNVELIDVNGDGLPDLVEATVNTTPGWNVWLNTGSNFIPAGQWYNYDSAHSNTCINNTNYYSDGSGGVKRDFIDINGDGLPDVVDPGGGSGAWQVWFNTGHGFTSAMQLWSFPDGSNNGYTRNVESDGNVTAQLLDINGDGLVEFVREDIGNQRWQVYSNMTGPADLLSKVTDRLGGTISVSYNSSTKYSNTRLPFNYWVVGSVTANNEMSGPQAVSATTSYSYAQGLYDFPTKEFRGFGQVTETRADGTKAIHYFRQDLPNDTYQGLKGKEYEADVQSSSGAPFTSTQNSWYSVSANGVFAPLLSEKDDYTYDGVVDNPKMLKDIYLDYDSFGNVTVEIRAGDQEPTWNYTNFSYNQDLWILERVSHKKVTATMSGPTLRESWYYYDGASSSSTPPTAGNLTKEEHYLDTGGNTVTTYGYDSYGNQTGTTDPNGHTTKVQYDSFVNTFPVQTTNALGQVTKKSYDPGTGNILQLTDPNGYLTQYSYDVFGRKTSEVKPYDSSQFPTTSISYSLNGTAPSSVTVSKRETAGQAGTLDTLQFVDGFGQLIQTTTESWVNSSTTITTDVFYDNMGRLSKQTNPFFSSSGFSGYLTPTGNELGYSYLYDTLGRPIQTTDPDSTTVTRTFDHWNVTETDENKHAKSYLFDAYQRLIQVTENNSGQSYITQYSRDPLGQLTQITDNLGKLTTFQYDTLGRKTSMADPDLGAWSYTYDPVGNLISQTDAKGITTRIGYDPLNRKLSVQTPNSSIAYTYDLPTIGTLSSAQNNDSGEVVQTSWTYDQRLRKIGETLQLDGSSWSTSWTYDSMDRVATQTYPNGETVTFNYNAQGLDNIPGIVSALQYNPAGHPTLKSYANGNTTNYGYDSATLRLTGLAAAGIQNLSYSYDKVGNIKTIADGISGRTESFSYDDLDRLVQAGDSGYQRAYQYDSVGDMLVSNKDGTTSTYSYNSGHEHAVSGMTVPFPVVGSFVINNGSQYTGTNKVTLTNVSFGNPASYMASEDPGFKGASWQKYSASPSFTLSSGSGKKTVYFMVKNNDGPSDAKSADIEIPAAPVVILPSSSTSTAGTTLGATIQFSGAQPVTSAGVACGTSINPDISGIKKSTTITSGAFTVNVTGLAANTVYHFRGYATNSLGTGYTADMTFTTISGPPTATAATALTGSGFTVNWTAPSGTAPITGYRLDVAADQAFRSIVSGYNNLSVSGLSQAVTGLTAGKSYYYRVRAVNAGGTSTSSNIITVKVPVPPTVDKPTVSSITTGGATLGATIESNGGLTVTASGVAYGTSANPVVSTGQATSPTVTSGAFTVNLAGLASNMVYHYRGYATNSVGTGYTADATFTTISGAPTATAATALSASGFTANWVAPSGNGVVTGYRLDVATDSGFGSMVPGYSNLLVTGTGHAVTGLSRGKPYYYRVRAVNAGGTSISSNIISVTTYRPPTIDSPTVSSITTGGATLGATIESNGGTPVTASGVAYGTTVNPTTSGTKTTATATSGAFTVNVTGLASNTVYHYRGYATNVAGTSYTSGSTFMTVSSPPKATAATAVSASGFTANWTAPTGSAAITGYRLDVATDSGFGSMVSGYGNLSVSGTSQTVAGLSAGNSYYYRVRAMNAGGTSTSSNIISVTTVSGPPTATAATALSASGFTANWVAPSGNGVVTGYRLDVATDSGFGSMVPGYSNLLVTGTGHAVTGLSAGKTYYYRVRAVNAGGTSTNSDIVTVTTYAAPTVDKPTISSIATSGVALGATIESNGGTSVTSAGVAYGRSANPTTSGTKAATAATSGAFAVSVTSLASNTLYHYRGYATNVAGTGYTSDSPFTTVSGAPTATAATAQTNSGFTAHWTAPSGNGVITRYQLDVATDQGFVSMVTGYSNLLVTGLSQSVTGLSAGEPYYYRVRAVNAGGTSTNSNVISVTTTGVKASAGPDQKVSQLAAVRLSGANSVNYGTGGTSYQWTQLDGSPVTLGNPSAVETSFVAPEGVFEGESLTFQLTVAGSDGSRSEDKCIVNVVKDNSPPTADAGSNQMVSGSQIVMLDGSKSSVQNGGMLSYSWRQVAGPLVALSDPSAAQPTFVAPNVGAAGESLVFELTLTDQTGLRSRDTCIVNVVSGALPPKAQIGPNQSVRPGAKVILDGSGSSDENGAITSYVWKQLAGPPVTLSDPTAIRPSFTAPVIDTATEELVFELTVTDPGGLQDKAKVAIAVISAVRK